MGSHCHVDQELVCQEAVYTRAAGNETAGQSGDLVYYFLGSFALSSKGGKNRRFVVGA